MRRTPCVGNSRRAEECSRNEPRVRHKRDLRRNRAEDGCLGMKHAIGAQIGGGPRRGGFFASGRIHPLRAAVRAHFNPRHAPSLDERMGDRRRKRRHQDGKNCNPGCDGARQPRVHRGIVGACMQCASTCIRAGDGAPPKARVYPHSPEHSGGAGRLAGRGSSRGEESVERPLNGAPPGCHLLAGTVSSPPFCQRPVPAGRSHSSRLGQPRNPTL